MSRHKKVIQINKIMGGQFLVILWMLGVCVSCGEGNGDSTSHGGSDGGPSVNNGSDDEPALNADWVEVTAGGFWMGSPNGICPTDYPEGSVCSTERGRGYYAEGETGPTDNELLHYVKLTHSFKMMATEVTQAQFNEILGFNPSRYTTIAGDELESRENAPVDYVKFYDALAYANRLSEMSGLRACYDFSDFCCEGQIRKEEMEVVDGGVPDVELCYNSTYQDCYFDDREEKGIISAVVKTANDSIYDCSGYRLPTEAEWEYAARAGTLTAFYNGDITALDEDPNLDKIAWYSANSAYDVSDLQMPHPVAQKESNAWGLYDMLGNVSEWIWDAYYEDYSDGDTQDPVIDPETRDFVTSEIETMSCCRPFFSRGGDYYEIAEDCRVAARMPDEWATGFRLVRTIQ